MSPSLFYCLESVKSYLAARDDGIHSSRW